MAAVIWLLLVVLTGCGVDVLELTPGLDVLVVGQVPTSAITRLAADDSAAKDPKMLTLAYPADGVAIPADLAPIRFQWSGPKKPESTVYELRLHSPSAELRVYTQAGDVTVPPDRWSGFLTRALGEDVRCELRALALMGKGELRAAETRILHVRPALATGALYLLAKSVVTQAQLSDSVSAPSQESPQRAQGATDARGRVAHAGRSRIEIREGARVVATWLAPEGSRLAHPSWAPDGNSLAFTYWPPELALADDPSDDHEGSGIATLSADGATFALLVADGSRPRFSPDGRWLAYQSAGKAMSNAEDASLRMVASSGGSARRLACGAEMMMKPKQAELPGRSPTWLANGWLAFISSAAHGDAMKRQQLWLSELDLTSPPPAMPMPGMPLQDVACSPPLWLPFQSPDTDYDALSR